MYNASRTIERCINSVIAQTYNGNYEIIVINDGSKDNSLSIVESFIKTSNLSNVKIINKTNGGVSSARNAGLKVANGNWIALLDSDDEWLPDKIAKQMEVLNSRPEIDFLGCNLVNQPTKLLWRFKKRLMPIKLWELFVKFHPQTSTAIFKSSIIKEVGLYNEKMRYAEDGEYWVRICMKKNCWFISEQLVVFDGEKSGFGEGGLSGNLVEMQKGVERILKLAYSQKGINIFQYTLFFIYAKFKYFRRKFIVWEGGGKMVVLQKIWWWFTTQLQRFRFKKIGWNSYIATPIFIYGRNIEISNKVRIFPHSRFETHFVGSIKICENVSIGQNFHITSARQLLEIGAHTTISGNVFITNIDHDYTEIGKHILKQQYIVKETKIGENCFIGYGVAIQAGTILGKQCVIGANSVVRGTFPDYCVIVGVPARIVKRYDAERQGWFKTDEKGVFIS